MVSDFVAGKPLGEVDLLKIVGETCHFIMREVVHQKGKYIHKLQEYFSEDQYDSLRNWHLEKYRLTK